MKWVFTTVHFTWRWTLRLCVLLLLLTVLLVIVGGWLLTYLDTYRDDLEQALSAQLNVPVHIERLEAGWQGLNPVLRLEGFQLQNPFDGTPLTGVARATATLAVRASLRQRQPQIDSIRLDGGRLVLEWGTDNALRLIPQAVGNPPLDLERLVHGLINVGAFELRTDELLIQAADGRFEPLLFRNLHLRITGGAPLQLALTVEPAGAAALRMAVELEEGGQGWMLAGSWQYGARPAQPLAVSITPTQLEGRIAGLTLAGLGAVAATVKPDWRTPLAALAPSAQLGELTFSATPDGTQYQAALGFTGLQWQSWQHNPAVTGLAGQLQLDQNGGHLRLDSPAARITSTLLREPVTLSTLQGDVHWHYAAAGLTLSAPAFSLGNPDLQLRGHGSLQLGAQPFLDLELDIDGGQLGRVPAYLPVAVMSQKLSHWLDNALVSGRIRHGYLIWQGRLADFPFDQGNGRFESRIQVEDAILDYQQDWPRIEELEAEVTFHNRRFAVEAIAGKILDADLVHVSGQIADLHWATLRLQGQITSAGATLLRFVRESPLAAKLSGLVLGLQLRGDNKLNLDLTLPLEQADPTPVGVDGELLFTGGSVTLPEPALTLEQVHGPLHFTTEGVTAEDLRLVLRNRPARLNLTSRSRGNRDEIQATLRTNASLAELLDDAGQDIGTYAKGRSDWTLNLEVLSDATGKLDDLTLNLTSRLRGIALALPPPLAKTATETRPLTARLRTVDQEWRLDLDYGDDIRAALALSKTQPLHLVRGLLRIGGEGEITLPETPGLAIQAQLASFSVPDGASGTLPAALHSIEARIGKLDLRGQQFSDVTLHAERQPDAFAVTVQGQNLAGRLYLPLTPSRAEPIQAEFQRLALRLPTATTGALPDPRQLPPLHLAISALALDGLALGQLRLSALPDADGLKLVDLELATAAYHLSGSADWLNTASGQQSRLELAFASRALGAALNTLGIDSGLDGAATTAQLMLHWPGALLRPAPELFTGTLTLHSEPGRLRKIEPGIGRLLGLLNLDSLARRLTFNFSDLTQEGLAFDSINGRLDFRAGAAHVEQFLLSGPSVQIEASGQIALSARTLDLVVAVTPQIGSPLSIAGAIAGGPAVGAALFLADKLLPEGVDTVGRYEYRVTGPWTAPVVAEQSTPAAAPTPLENRNR